MDLHGDIREVPGVLNLNPLFERRNLYGTHCQLVDKFEGCPSSYDGSMWFMILSISLVQITRINNFLYAHYRHFEVVVFQNWVSFLSTTSMGKESPSGQWWQSAWPRQSTFIWTSSASRKFEIALHCHCKKLLRCAINVTTGTSWQSRGRRPWLPKCFTRLRCSTMMSLTVPTDVEGDRPQMSFGARKMYYWAMIKSYMEF